MTGLSVVHFADIVEASEGHSGDSPARSIVH